MLTDKPVLIVEDNIYLALDLSAEVESMNGRVVGPVGSIPEALDLLDREEVSAAVLGVGDAARDLTPLARALVARRLPFVVHASQSAPLSLRAVRPGIPVLIRPIQPHDLVSILANEVLRFEHLPKPVADLD